MKKTCKLLSAAVIIAAIISCGKQPASDNGGKPSTEEISLPQDPYPGSTDFRKKVLITDFTGAGCPFCPDMTKILRKVISNSAYKESTILTIAHTFKKDGDPAYLNSSLPSVMGIKSYPTLIFDLRKEWVNGLTSLPDANSLQTQLDIQIKRNPAIAGICTASVIKDGNVTIKAGVKSGAEKATDYYVGILVLEDGIIAEQANAPDPSYNIHNDCIRMIEGCSQKSFAGTRLDNILKKGESGEITFSFSLDKNIVKSNCKYVAYVSCAGEDGNFKVVNAISAQFGEPAKYQYN